MIDFLRRIALSRGIWIGRGTPVADVRDLIDRLTPASVSRPLIRLGPDHDGGYVIPDDLDGIVAAISPGVGAQSGFEIALAERGIPVHMADGSVDGPTTSHPLFRFTRKFIGLAPDDLTTTLDDLCRPIIEAAPGDLLMQIDIEGAEFRVIAGMSRELLDRCRIVIVEFHGLHELFDRPAFPLIADAVAKMLVNHEVVHAHPNNCCGAFRFREFEIPRVMEFTFYRRDRDDFRRTSVLPEVHPLDAPNLPERPMLALPAAWRRQPKS